MKINQTHKTTMETSTEKTAVIERSELLNVLHMGILEVEFIKKDGPTRVMQATLAPELLPPIKDGEAMPRSNEGGNPDLVNVFDVEAQGWRCFKISSLTKRPVNIRIGVGASECADGMCSDCNCQE